MRCPPKCEEGFTLVEVLVALLLTTVVLGSVFQTLAIGQTVFVRDTEIAILQQNTRDGLRRISADLLPAGDQTPPPAAVLWNDGGAAAPDAITIVSADAETPALVPFVGTLSGASELRFENPFDPSGYPEGEMLAAFESSDCNDDDHVGIFLLETTAPPFCSDPSCATWVVPYRESELALFRPSGFNDFVSGGCALVRSFRFVQYRIGPSMSLERRDLKRDDTWMPVAAGIEDLQLQFSVGAPASMFDVPTAPRADDPDSWIRAVRVRVTGASVKKNLVGSTSGASGVRLRMTFTTAVSLRNQETKDAL